MNAKVTRVGDVWDIDIKGTPKEIAELIQLVNEEKKPVAKSFSYPQAVWQTWTNV
ncbi:hypothetical protein M5X04_27010 [Paenibacillus alvei]|uniref:Uncharacterized protein n=1 Tax=Paenibacillus alvei TaxID=44250 RepID=A0ABT4EGT6_PAEAL|nr:hypothetical protein [Paenibacillus alvei]MCY9532964.1 hypothetical protein [Paenibacillus alvei]